MRAANVFYNGILTGLLTEHGANHFTFAYEDSYWHNTNMPAISLTIPKTTKVHNSAYLFPFFYNMLAEGVNRKLQARALHIDEEDAFGLLLATAGSDTIGAITVKPVS